MWTSVTSFLWVNIDFRGEGQRHLAKTPIGLDGELLLLPYAVWQIPRSHLFSFESHILRTG